MEIQINDANKKLIIKTENVAIFRVNENDHIVFNNGERVPGIFVYNNDYGCENCQMRGCQRSLCIDVVKQLLHEYYKHLYFYISWKRK
jgi:hypothetical protein